MTPDAALIAYTLLACPFIAALAYMGADLVDWLKSEQCNDAEIM